MNWELLLTTNRIWKQRTVDIGGVLRANSVGLGIFRPPVASVRRSLGSAAGATLDKYARGVSSQVPVTRNGELLRPVSDPADKRCAKASIIKQCLEKLKIPGPVKVEDRKFFSAKAKRDEALVEALIHHFQQ